MYSSSKLHADSYTLVHLVTTLFLSAKECLFGFVITIAARNLGSHLFIDALKNKTRYRHSGTTRAALVIFKASAQSNAAIWAKKGSIIVSGWRRAIISRALRLTPAESDVIASISRLTERKNPSFSLARL
jgi:hypothetical protein